MSALFGSKPKPADPVRMPVQDDATARAAKERKRRDIASRSGRESTRLSRSSGSPGTSSYGNSLLGSAG